MNKKNLNELKLSIDAPRRAQVPQEDFHVISLGADVEVFFKDLEANLVDKILAADAVVGCVAWLTNYRLLEALGKVSRGVNLVVQKEDFLRPDKTKTSKLRSAYAALKVLERWDSPGKHRGLSVCSSPADSAVRCVGNHNSDKAPAHPRMHHKFVAFLRAVTVQVPKERLVRNGQGTFEKAMRLEESTTFKPYAVWTGSFNFTDNATRSFENAVYIEDEAVAQAFANEHSQILALSEELDWTTAWAKPQYWIGS